MRNIWRLYVIDMRNLFKNAIAGIIILGLVFLPSIFSWYNILACWNVFDNTGNLTVAVANSDEGYESDLVPLRINVGERVESALRANDQLNWVFVNEADAIDGVMSGNYYAAVVIPSSFSQDMMTFYSSQAEHADIIYYTNEKKSAVAPKVTDQGADQISHQVNTVFIETLSEIALDIAKGVQKYANENDLGGHIGSLGNTVDAAADDIDQTAKVLRSYSALALSAKKLIASSSSLVTQTSNSLSSLKDSANLDSVNTASVTSTIQGAVTALAEAIGTAGHGYDELSASIAQMNDSGAALADDANVRIREHIAKLDEQISNEENVISNLKTLAEDLDLSQLPVVKSAISRMESAVAMQVKLKETLEKTSAEIESGKGDARRLIDEAAALSTRAKDELSSATSEFENNVRPKLDDLSARISTAVGKIEADTLALENASGTLSGKADSAVAKLDEVTAKLDATAAKLEDGATKLRNFATSLAQALASNDIDMLNTILGSDPSVLANAISAPVVLDRHALFPADNFGSQMAPLYTVLAIWVGSLLLVVAIKVGVTEETRRRLGNPTLSQIFLGRFGVFATLSLMQTTVMGLGNWLFLGVQVNNPLLFMLCFWFSGLVFVFIMYSLVVSFANLGKAVGVLLLILQVTAAGGSFPLQLLPSIFQTISPYVPATHVINMMRAAMMGVYQNDFWIEMGQLAIFIIPMAVLGLALRKPLIRFLDWYIERVEDSKLVN